LIHRAGYLTKQGDVIRSWRKRWFVLSDDAMRYYRDESHDELKGEIALSVIIRAKVGATRGRGGRTATFVVETEDRDWLIQADSEASRDAWVQAINRLLVTPPPAVIVRSLRTESPSVSVVPESDDDDDDDIDQDDVDVNSDAVVGVPSSPTATRLAGAVHTIAATPASPQPGVATSAATTATVATPAVDAEPVLSREEHTAAALKLLQRDLPESANTLPSQYIELPCVREVDDILARVNAAERANAGQDGAVRLSPRVPLVDSDDDDDGDEVGNNNNSEGTTMTAEQIEHLERMKRDSTLYDPMLDEPTSSRGPSLVVTKGRVGEFVCATCSTRQRMPCFSIGARSVCEPCALSHLPM
jgi:hypothetical protein